MGRVFLRWFGAAAAPLIALFAPAAAAAATITVNETRTTVSITGKILPGDEEKFQDSVFDLPEGAAMVILDSPGGIVGPALEIGQAIRLKRFNTLVQNGAQCASAYALAWLAGRTLYMAPGAKIGFHAAYEFREERGNIRVVLEPSVARLKPIASKSSYRLLLDDPRARDCTPPLRLELLRPAE